MRHFHKRLRGKHGTQLVLVIALLLLLPLLLLEVRSRQISRQNAAEGTKPNVILILTDDQPDNTLNYLPQTAAALGDRGVTFTNAFVTTGLCCPSRASILTGEYTHNHGVWTDSPPNGGVQTFSDKETLPVWLQRAGYKTALVGEYMNEYDQLSPYIPPGWNDWFAFDDDNGKYFDYKINDNGTIKTYGSNASDYSTDVLAEEAVRFIRNTDGPFFLYFAPHAPHDAPVPAPRDASSCPSAELPKGPAYNEADVSDKPQWVRNLPLLSATESKDQEQEYARKMCTLPAVDDAVMSILNGLGDERHNTLIIYMSDNGYAFGDHRWTKNGCFYKACVGVDMIMSYPKLTPDKKTSNEFALNIDLAPTILDLAGIPLPASVDGKSLKPLLTNPSASVHNSFLIETYDSEGDPEGKDYGIQTKEFKYQELATGEKELYDLKKDPDELESQHLNNEYAVIRADLANMLYLMKNNKPVPPITKTPTPTRTGTPSPAPKPSATGSPSPNPSKKPPVTPTKQAAPTPTRIPTLTPTPEIKHITADLNISVLLDGIGRAGDFVRADQANFSNKNPYNETKDFTIDLYDMNDNYITSVFGTADYSLRYGGFQGTLRLDEDIPILKEYTVRIYATNYLIKKFPETVLMKDGDTIDLPEITLISGDVNDDNELNILDYNLIVYCYGRIIPYSCFDDAGIIGDLNDDGFVLEQDYNLFLRELPAKEGD